MEGLEISSRDVEVMDHEASHVGGVRLWSGIPQRWQGVVDRGIPPNGEVGLAYDGTEVIWHWLERDVFVARDSGRKAGGQI